MGSWSALSTQNSIGSSTPFHTIIFVLATKQALLSVKNWLIMLCLDLFQIVSSLDLMIGTVYPNIPLSSANLY